MYVGCLGERSQCGRFVKFGREVIMLDVHEQLTYAVDGRVWLSVWCVVYMHGVLGRVLCGV